MPKTPEHRSTKTTVDLLAGVSLAGKRLKILGGTTIVFAPIALMGWAYFSNAPDHVIPPSPQDTASTTQSFDNAIQPPITIQESAVAINETIQETLQQTPTTSPIITEENVATHEVDGLHLNPDNSEIYYHDWLVPEEVYQANIQTAQITGLPLSYTFAVQSLESSFDPDAFNRIKACGLSQFVPDTLSEKAYKYADLYACPNLLGP